MSFKTPGQIEFFFRKELGDINPYMCIIDSAVKEIKKKSILDIGIINKNNGHPNIHLHHLNLDNLSYLVSMSHIAYINSKAETACTFITNLKEINKAHKNADIGDFLRKTIFVVHRSKHKLEELKSTKNYDFDADIKEEALKEYMPEEEFQLIDYYRKLRNSTFHNNKNTISLSEYFNESMLESIENKFGYRPNTIQDLNENDIYILSLAWQNTIKSICKSCINLYDSIIPTLEKKYKNVNKERAINGIRQSLKQEYLLTEDKINDIIDTLNIVD